MSTSSSSMSFTSTTKCSICDQYGVIEGKTLRVEDNLVEQRIYICGRHSEIEIERYKKLIKEHLNKKAIVIRIENKGW